MFQKEFKDKRVDMLILTKIKRKCGSAAEMCKIPILILAAVASVLYISSLSSSLPQSDVDARFYKSRGDKMPVQMEKREAEHPSNKRWKENKAENKKRDTWRDRDRIEEVDEEEDYSEEEEMDEEPKDTGLKYQAQQRAKQDTVHRISETKQREVAKLQQRVDFPQTQGKKPPGAWKKMGMSEGEDWDALRNARPGPHTHVETATQCRSTHKPDLNQAFWSHESRPKLFRYIINNVNVCKEPDLSILFMIHSMPDHRKLRNLVRETWGSVKEYNGVKIEHAFLLGAGGNDSSVKEESKKHHDIIQANFQDTFMNKTLKSVIALRWASTFCRKAKVVFKVNDNLLVNTYLVAKLMEQHGYVKQREIICGSLVSFPRDLEPTREASNRWTARRKVTMQQYPDQCFPTHCLGLGGYGLTPEYGEALYQQATRTRSMPLEDVYITGLLPALLQQPVTKLRVGGFAYLRGPITMNWVLKVAFIAVSNEEEKPLQRYKEAWNIIYTKHT